MRVFAHRQRRPFSQSDTMKAAARQVTSSPGGRFSGSCQVARPMCSSITDATVARVDCRCEIASQAERERRTTTSDADAMLGGVRNAGGDPRAADRAVEPAWSPVPPFAAVVVETEPLDEWLTTNSLWWLMLAPADQLTPRALVGR
jgi:hypothetical protein